MAENKIYYRSLPCRTEPLEFYDSKEAAEFMAAQTHCWVRECTVVSALNALLDKIRALQHEVL